MSEIQTHLDRICILVRLVIKVPSFIKRDKDLSWDVAQQNDVKDDSRITVEKQLIDVKSHLGKLKSIKVQAQSFLREHSFPFDDSQTTSYEDSNSQVRNRQLAGNRLVLMSKYDNFLQEKLLDYQEDFNSLVDKFLREYPTLIAQQSHGLGNAYNINEYPDVEVLKHKFFFEFDASGIPQTSLDPRMNISQETRERIENSARSKERNVVKNAMRTFISSIAEQGKMLSQKLKEMNNEESNKFFKVEAFEKFAEAVALIPEYNETMFGNNVEIKKVHTELNNLLKNITSLDSLRNDKRKPNDEKIIKNRKDLSDGLDKALDPLNDAFFKKLGGKNDD